MNKQQIEISIRTLQSTISARAKAISHAQRSVISRKGFMIADKNKDDLYRVHVSLYKAYRKLYRQLTLEQYAAKALLRHLYRLRMTIQ